MSQSSETGVPQHIPSERAADAAYYAAIRTVEEDRQIQAAGSKEPYAPQELASKVRKAVQESAKGMPRLEWFPDCVEPGQNTNLRLRASLHGRLIVTERCDPSGKEGGKEERYGLNWDEFNALMARLLTLVDATFQDAEQRSAFKALVKNQVKEWVAGIVADAAADALLALSHTPYVGGVLDNVKPEHIHAHAEAVGEQSSRG